MAQYKITEKRVSEITMDELEEIISLTNKEELKVLMIAIKSGNKSRIQAAFEVSVFRMINKYEDK